MDFSLEAGRTRKRMKALVVLGECAAKRPKSYNFYINKFAQLQLTRWFVASGGNFTRISRSIQMCLACSRTTNICHHTQLCPWLHTYFKLEVLILRTAKGISRHEIENHYPELRVPSSPSKWANINPDVASPESWCGFHNKLCAQTDPPISVIW